MIKHMRLARYRAGKILWRLAALIEGPPPIVLGETLVSGTTLAQGRCPYCQVSR